MTQQTMRRKTNSDLYDYRILANVKQYLSHNPGASAYAIARDLKMPWVTANRYKLHITGNTSV